mmetsp:Transcript_30003/g.90191  ORF Transcript_30003/g.90191 Transcript_30003/m.90191 type:complete len:211 (-) Transcript_30003:350-982(-)
MQYDNHQVRVGPFKQRQVGRQLLFVGFVERDGERALAREFEQDKRADVHEADSARILPPLVRKEADRHDEAADVAFDQDVLREGVVQLQQLPKEHQHLLVALDLRQRPGERRVERLVDVVEQAREAREEKVERLAALDAREELSEDVAARRVLGSGGRRLARAAVVEEDHQRLRRQRDDRPGRLGREVAAVRQPQPRRVVGAHDVQERVQ